MKTRCARIECFGPLPHWYRNTTMKATLATLATQIAIKPTTYHPSLFSGKEHCLLVLELVGAKTGIESA